MRIEGRTPASEFKFTSLMGYVPTVREYERSAVITETVFHDLANEHRVVTGIVFSPGSAFEVGQCTAQARSHRALNPAEGDMVRLLPGKVAGEALRSLGKDIYRKWPSPQQPVATGTLINRDEDKRRSQRQ